MACEKFPLVSRLAVLEPETLKDPAWQDHLRECPPCREGFLQLGRSLAVYRQLEREQLDQLNAEPSWEAMGSRLKAQSKRRIWHRAIRMPLVAGVAGLLLAGGLAGWQPWQDAPPRETAQETLSSGDTGRTAKIRALPRQPAIPVLSRPQSRSYSIEYLIQAANPNGLNPARWRIPTRRNSPNSVEFVLGRQSLAAPLIPYDPRMPVGRDSREYRIRRATPVQPVDYTLAPPSRR